MVPLSAYAMLRPLLLGLPPETAHDLTLRVLERLGPQRPSYDPILRTTLAGLDLPSPIGLAAGFDKDARVWRQMLGLGFGFVEVGTLTPRSQVGNPRPRVFRLPKDGAVINRLGFNNGGLAAAMPRLAPHPGLGVNVGANKDSDDRIADYVAAVAAVRETASWITLNISSPNTPGLRGLQGAALPELLAAAREARGEGGPPLFLKVAPDLDPAQIDAIAGAALAAPVDAVIVSNTTIARPQGLVGRHAGEAGGLSGRPLMAPSTVILADFARATAGRLPLVGAGGVATLDDVLAKFRAGASAIQLYTALVYEGPGLVARLNRQLAAWLRAAGLASPADIPREWAG
ncbi:MAG: quinone-dependent dihydroorotate dehydrogenase [Thermaurantiacus sp.]